MHSLGFTQGICVFCGVENLIKSIFVNLMLQDGYADNRSETSQGTVVQDGKFSMMEFALLHFRESLQK